MPTYEYHCLDCNKTFSVALTIKEHDEHTPPCPGCSSKNVRQVYSSVSVVTSKKS